MKKKNLLNNIDFYFITDSKLTRKTVIDDVKAVIKGGAKIVQYREKELPTKQMLEEALEIKKICDQGEVIFIVNDRVDICLAVDADGVHIGQDDMPYGIARRLLGNKIIGLTVHNVNEAIEAERIGADYVGVSPIFHTDTKKDAGRPAGLGLIKDIKDVIKIPQVAIGGINQGNLQSVLDVGARSVVMISAILGKDDIEQEVKDVISKIKNDSTA